MGNCFCFVIQDDPNDKHLLTLHFASLIVSCMYHKSQCYLFPPLFLFNLIHKYQVELRSIELGQISDLMGPNRQKPFWTWSNFAKRMWQSLIRGKTKSELFLPERKKICWIKNRYGALLHYTILPRGFQGIHELLI